MLEKRGIALFGLILFPAICREELSFELVVFLTCWWLVCWCSEFCFSMSKTIDPNLYLRAQNTAKSVRKIILAIRRKAVRLQRETEIYPKQGEMSVLTCKP